MNTQYDVVIVNCFETCEHRVELLKGYFARQGKRVRVITSNWKHFDKVVRTECPEDYELIPVPVYRKNLSAARLWSHHVFAREALRRTQALQPALLWVMAPPNSLVKRAAAFKKQCPQTVLILDMIDMWPESMPIAGLKSLPPMAYWRSLRDKHIAAADAVVTECALYQTLLQKVCPAQKLHTLYLAREVQPLLTQPALPEDRIGLCYLGSINNIIDIPCIRQIIEGIGRKVELHIIGGGERQQELIDEATAVGAEVVFHGKVFDPEKKQRIFDSCHFGLNIMKSSVFVGLTMKSMDYWEASLPVINTIRGDTWELVERYGIGLNYTPGQPLPMEQLLQLQQGRHKVRQMFDSLFTRQVFEQELAKILESLR